MLSEHILYLEFNYLVSIHSVIINLLINIKHICNYINIGLHAMLLYYTNNHIQTRTVCVAHVHKHIRIQCIRYTHTYSVCDIHTHTYTHAHIYIYIYIYIYTLPDNLKLDVGD